MIFVSVNGMMDGAQYRATQEVKKKALEEVRLGQMPDLLFSRAAARKTQPGATEEQFHLQNINVPGWPHQSPTQDPIENL